MNFAFNRYSNIIKVLSVPKNFPDLRQSTTHGYHIRLSLGIPFVFLPALSNLQDRQGQEIRGPTQQHHTLRCLLDVSGTFFFDLFENSRDPCVY